MLSESSDPIVEGHIDSTEIQSAEHRSGQSGYSSGKDVASPSKEVNT